jgi:predicted methyltransferase
VIRPGGRLVLVDWTADGDGESGPPTDHRYDAADAIEALETAGFEVLTASTRPETFLVTARAP